MTDTEMILQAIGELKVDIDRRFEAVDQRFEAVDQRFQSMDSKIDSLKTDMNNRFDEVNEKIDALDTSIGMLAEWADDVAVVVKIPFAQGKASIQ